MIVTKQSFQSVLAQLKSKSRLALDTETQGLRPYSGDKVFSIIIAESETLAYYFNFNPLEPRDLLGEEELAGIRELCAEKGRLWYKHNAMYDCVMLLESMGIEVKGDVFCTFAQGRVEHNDHMLYSLDASLKRIGLSKDGTVDSYIKAHGLTTSIQIPDKKEAYVVKHFEHVPLEIIVPYACTDACGTFALGERLSSSIEEQSKSDIGKPSSLGGVKSNEMALHHAILRSTTRGVLLDVPYIKRAIGYERERLHSATREFEAVSGLKYSNHFKTFERAFEVERANFSYGERTKTGQINPVFDEEVLKRFKHPLAGEVLKARDAQGKLNFYNSYLFYRDSQDVLHPNMVSGGTNTGRMSSNEPNMQNITSEDLMTCRGCGKGYEHITVTCPKCGGISFEAPEFLVRRAFIPRPDYCSSILTTLRKNLE
jgi:DNA polymerase I-like protein with 3'-5' exonuclease and polymerase domains